VFQRPGPRENLDLVRIGQPDRLPQVPARRSEEGIRRALVADRRRHGRTTFGAQPVDLVGTALQRRVARLDRQRETRVRLRVLVRAVEPRVIGPLQDLAERGPHLRRAALEQAPAAHREQRIADECDPVVRKVIHDVSASVPRRLPHDDPARAEAELVAVADLDLDAGNAPRVGAGADDPAAGRGLELEIPARVIGVMMGIEDVRQRPAALLERAQYRRDLRRIDACGDARVRVVHQKPVVVPQAREHLHFDLAHSAVSRFRILGAVRPAGGAASPDRYRARGPFSRAPRAYRTMRLFPRAYATAMPLITLPDGSTKAFDEPVDGLALARSIGARLEKDAVAMRVDGELKDLTAKIDR